MIKQKKIINIGIIHLKFTFNNIIITICDLNGNVICWTSAGIAKKETKRVGKSTLFAAQAIIKSAIKRLLNYNIKKVLIFFKGSTIKNSLIISSKLFEEDDNIREALINALKNINIEILTIQDKTSLPHNGCRLPKKRRL